MAKENTAKVILMSLNHTHKHSHHHTFQTAFASMRCIQCLQFCFSHLYECVFFIPNARLACFVCHFDLLDFWPNKFYDHKTVCIFRTPKLQKKKRKYVSLASFERDEAHGGWKSQKAICSKMWNCSFFFLFVFFVISPPRRCCHCFLSFTFYFLFERMNKNPHTYCIYSSQCVGVWCVRVVIYGPSVFVGICRTAGLPLQIFSPDACTILMWYRWSEYVYGFKRFWPSDLGK